jgi:hypothetical protein
MEGNARRAREEAKETQAKETIARLAANRAQGHRVIAAHAAEDATAFAGAAEDAAAAAVTALSTAERAAHAAGVRAEAAGHAAAIAIDAQTAAERAASSAESALLEAEAAEQSAASVVNAIRAMLTAGLGIGIGELGPHILGELVSRNEPLILIRKSGPSWIALIPFVDPGWVSQRDNISAVVAEARAMSTTAGVDPTRLKIKVTESTALQFDDVLELVEANEGPWKLDLSHCILELQVADVPGRLANRVPGESIPRWAYCPSADSARCGLNLYGAKLAGAFLEDAELKGANLKLADLRQSNLDLARLQGAVLVGARLQDATLEKAQLDQVDLRRTRLEGMDWLGIESLAGAMWSDAILDRTRITRQQLGDAISDEPTRGTDDPQSYRRASEAYLLLKNNFASIGRYGDASWAYFKEQCMIGKEHRAKGQRWRWITNCLARLLTGYGERPTRPFVAAIIVVIIFAGLYLIFGGIDIRYGDGGESVVQSLGPGDALVHSMGSFFTVSFSNTEPTGAVARLLTVIEGGVGIGLFALLVWTLGNRISRS